jgi:hypothetical protein
MLSPAFAPKFPWPFLCTILPGIGFVVGGVFGRFRDRWADGKQGPQ